jgi:TrmH family RNA methyltransferase
MSQTLLSDQNPLVKQVRRAVSKGASTEDGFAIAEGFHLLEEALASKCEIGAVFVAESFSAELPAMNGTRVAVLSDRTFAAVASTETPQGVIALVRLPEWKLEQMIDRALIVVIDGVQDPGNAGAIVRAAEAFGATGAVFLKGSANPYNPKALRASAGSIFRLPMIAQIDGSVLLGALDENGIAIYAAAPRGGKMISHIDLNAPCAIVIGAEGGGVRESLLDRSTRVRIATSGVESLNAAVATGVILYEAQRQRSAS